MKIILTTGFFILCLSLLTGCAGEKKEQKGTASDYSGGLLRIIDRAENARKMANLNALKAAISQYRVEHDKNPRTLEELKDQLGENFRFDDYIYNPETGEVTSKIDLK